jgi:membrane protein DedA with SNARE-associated domain
VAHLIDPLIAFVSDHSTLAYITIFLAALLEAIPIAGSVVPGTTIILALSALIPGGELRLQWVLLAAIIGAVLGDGSAFWIGHRRQREILTTWPFSNYPRLVAQSEAFFHRFGTLAIFFARFVAPIRAVVPITAGALDVPPVRFYAVNIPAIVLWACAHVLPGVFAVVLLHRYGGIPHHSHVAKPIWIALVIVGTLLAWFGLHLFRRRRDQSAMAKALNKGSDSGRRVRL